MKLSQAELGKLLDISQSLVSRYARQGMPTDDVKAARLWLSQLRPRVKSEIDSLAKRRY